MAKWPVREMLETRLGEDELEAFVIVVGSLGACFVPMYPYLKSRLNEYLALT
jgi:hypothetical protein